LVFYGAKFFQCPVAVYNSGAETGCSFVGSDIISEPFGGYGGSPERAIWIEGGFVTVVGGSVVKANTSTPQAILFNPANGASSNPYGLLRISGAHIETSCQLITVSNPRALSTPASTNSNITLVGVGGYAGLSGAEDFITVSDATYAGTIEVTSSNFYAPSARSAFNMSAAGALVKFVTDKTSFGTNFLQWPKGVSAGIRVDNTYPISNIGATVTGVAAATAIYTLLGSSLGTLVVVQGSDTTTNHYFVELVVFGNGGSAVVVGGGTVFGADVARTYSVVGTALRLAMGSGTYSVRCVPFEFYA
jgi:hypothetical protein